MANELVVSNGGAVAVPDSGAIGEHGDLSRDTGAVTRFGWSEEQSNANLRREILRDLVIEGIGEQVIEQCLPVIQRWQHALSVAETWETKSRVADGIRDELIGRGLLTMEQIERIRPILHRHSVSAPFTMEGVERRLAEIESWMGSPRGSAAYKRYYDDPLAQDEYRQLQRRKQ